MSEMMKARSACQRSRALGVVFAGATNTIDIQATPPEIQQKRILSRIAVSPAVAAVVAAHAFGVPDQWRGA